MGTKLLIGFGVVVALGLVAFVCGGCKASPSTALYQSIGTDRAAMVATTTLYQSGTVSRTDAMAVLKGGESGEAALHVWDAVNQTKSTANIQSAQTAASAALAAILQQLQNLQNEKVIPALKAQSATRPALARARPKFSAPAPAKLVLDGSVISLVELVVELAPEVEGWISGMLGTTTVTEDQITSAFTDLDAAIAALKAAVGN